MAMPRERFVAWMKERFFLRIHMAVILGFTFLAGLAVTKLLLETGNTNLALRYGMAVAASYVAFLMLMKAWLWSMDQGPGDVDADDVVDALDAATDVGSHMARDGSRAGFEGGGGRFGGGGASHRFADTGTSSPSGSSSGGSGVLDGISGDDDGLVLVLVIAVVALGIALSGLYLVYAGPTILAEAAFEALLAGSLLRGARKAESPGWVGGVVKATAIPFLIIFVLGVGLGWYANRACPQARKMAAVLECAGLR
jgi:hypothetical protein